MKYYAIPGETQQYVCKEKHAPSGAVEMVGPNPGDHEATPDGTWYLDPTRAWELELEAVVEDTGIPMWFQEHLVYDHNGKTDSPELREKLDLYKAKKADKPV